MSTIQEIINKAQEEGRKVLTEYESKELLKNIGLPIPEHVLVNVKDGENAVLEAAHKIGFPVVMKLIAEDIVHKTDVGAVKVNIRNDDDVKEAFKHLSSIPSEKEKYISVQEQAAEPITEVIIGTLQDAQFGPTIMFGIGGVLVEVMKDVSFRVAPISDFDAEEMIHEIKGFKLLDGYRGKPKADLEALKSALIKVAQLVWDHQEIKEMDLNPVFVYEKDLKVVDARIILK